MAREEIIVTCDYCGAILDCANDEIKCKACGSCRCDACDTGTCEDCGVKATNLMEVFIEEVLTDDETNEKKSNRLEHTFRRATPEQQAVIDDVFMTLCGWTFTTLLEK